MEHDWKDYFSFTRKERRGILVLVVLIGISMVVPYLTPGPGVDEEELLRAVRERQEELDRMVVDSGGDWRDDKYGGNQRIENYAGKRREPPDQPQVKLFEFDPNTLDSAGWRKLGVHDRSIRTIQNYLRKGGRFRKPEDLERIYGFRKEDYERLRSYIKIPPAAAQHYVKEQLPKPTPSIIDINTADTSAFISLPGIGSKLANRIITFREKLGGFYSVEQVRETYGLPDSTFQLIKPRLQCEPTVIRKININTADVNILKQHPYIKWPIANAIVQYRQQHGAYRSIEELKQIAIMTSDLFQKISTYLAIE